MARVKTHIMFQGDAQEAIDLYSSIFKDFTVGNVERYGEDEPVATGTFKTADVSFAGHDLLVFDSPPMHDFSITPSMSIYVDFDTVDELETAFAKLSEKGQVMMPLDGYGFSTRYGWVADRFGLSWQLNLP
jgi:predicted 3-demethylubiquinone-9 3-methyltransferase (glyoxalase superfamily)